MKGFFIFLISVAFLGCLFAFSCVDFKNQSVSFEQTIKAQVEDMGAKYNEYFTKVKEVAQVPKQQMSTLKEFYDTLVTGRKTNGEMMKWISESNPEINQDTFVELQRIISAGRESIYSIQKRHIDTVREYNTFINVFPNSFINGLFFKYTEKEPTVPISDMAKEVMETGDKVLEVF